MHKHNWKRANTGCRENPGVHSEGSKMIYSDRCNCGATRTTTASVITGNRGKLVEITDATGRTTKRDSRVWLYS